MVTQKVRTLRKGRGGWTAFVTNEVRARKFPPEWSAEDCLFDLELEGFVVDHLRKRLTKKTRTNLHTVDHGAAT